MKFESTHRFYTMIIN